MVSCDLQVVLTRLLLFNAQSISTGFLKGIPGGRWAGEGKMKVGDEGMGEGVGGGRWGGGQWRLARVG